MCFSSLKAFRAVGSPISDLCGCLGGAVVAVERAGQKEALNTPVPGQAGLTGHPDTMRA